jgi:hypothetical protein
MKKLFTLFFLFILSCGSFYIKLKDIDDNGVVLSSEKEILSFSIGEEELEIGTNSIEGSVSLCLSLNTQNSLENLTPVITISEGSSISPASGVAQDFTSPVTYTVTAEDGTTEEYVVTVIKGEYQLGDRGPAGGWIFYIDESCAFYDEWSYLEAAPADLASIIWSNVGVSISTEEAIGTGADNTAAIIAQPSHNNSAAKECNELIVDEFSDWFLPSQDELIAMHDNLCLADIGSFVPEASYWSSSETGAFTAFHHQFPNAEGGGNNVKSWHDYVRYIRAF